MLEPRYMPSRGDYLALPDSRGTSKWSLFILLLYFTAQPFNDMLHGIILVGGYVDLLWFVVLLASALLVAASGKAKFVGSFELTVVVLWMAYLVLLYVFASGRDRPEEGVASQATYNLRGFLQSVPVFILVAVRGLNKKELNAILTVIVLLMPISIFTAYQQLGVASLSAVQEFVVTGHGISYNLYVPYTTFPLFAAIYLFFDVKNILLKTLIACSFSIIAVFIFLNLSRQSVVFVLLSAFTFFVVTRHVKNALLFAIIAAVVAFSVIKLGLADRVMSRFFSEELFITNRTDLMVSGLDSIREPLKWTFGKGFEIERDDINPHNNYIFSTMRIGLVGMVLMFLPFVRAMLKLTLGIIRYGRQPWFDRNFAAFVMITILFVLFHSFFGFPHLDSVNGPIVWLGLGIWVIYNCDLQKRVLANRGVAHGYGCGDNQWVRQTN